MPAYFDFSGCDRIELELLIGEALEDALRSENFAEELFDEIDERLPIQDDHPIRDTIESVLVNNFGKIVITSYLQSVVAQKMLNEMNSRGWELLTPKKARFVHGVLIGLENVKRRKQKRTPRVKRLAGE